MKLQQYHQSRLALGSDCTLCVVSSQPAARVDGLFEQLWSIIFQFERQFSRFIPHSELSEFNRQAGLSVAITPEFRDILAASQRLSRTTAGLYNPFILPALQRAGYQQSHVEAYKADPQADYTARSVVDAGELKLGDDTATIPYGTALDLGGCGKGYLADLLADTAVPEWVAGYWFSLGGDVVGQGSDAQGRPWQITVADGAGHETSEGWYLQATARRFAAATSGTALRSGVHKGKRWHHIIDPETGLPATSDCSLATVYGTKALDMDVLASCAIILGSRRAIPFLRKQAVSAALLQTAADQIHFGRALRGKAANREHIQEASNV